MEQKLAMYNKCEVTILDKSKKMKSWQMALDMQKIDRYKPNQEFMKLIKDNINGKITSGDIIKRLDAKYKSKI